MHSLTYALDMDTYKAIKTRRSIRKFKQKPIPKSVLTKILESGRLAPSAGNLQPCEFIVVNEAKAKEDLFPALKWAFYIAPKGNPKKEDRPFTYIVTIVDIDKSASWGLIDATIAMESMTLAAWSFGVASCWLGAIDKDKIRQLLVIPKHYNVEFVLALGYPAEKSVVEKYKGDVKYWKDEKGVLHVPKRSLASTLHRNRF